MSLQNTVFLAYYSRLEANLWATLSCSHAFLACWQFLWVAGSCRSFQPVPSPHLLQLVSTVCWLPASHFLAVLLLAPILPPRSLTTESESSQCAVNSTPCTAGPVLYALQGPYAEDARGSVQQAVGCPWQICLCLPLIQV